MKISTARYLIGVLLLVWYFPADAARSHTDTIVNPVPAALDMGIASPLTIRVTNTNTGGNVGERIAILRFRINSGSTFSNTTAAPAGWTRTAFSATSMTFQATSWANAIAVGGFVDFSIVIIARTTTADVTDNLRDIRATYTTTTTGPPFTSLGTVTRAAPTPWTNKSLVVTLTPSSLSVPRNCTFTLTMQVTNRSSTNLTGVVSVPKPPTLVTTGGASATTTTNPANLNLNASGGTGSFVWTYTTGNTAGTLTFSASARDSVGTRTSRTITASVVTVNTSSCFIADFTTVAPTPTCIFSGDTVTFTMHVTNNTGASLSNVQPSALTRGGTATIGAFTGPAPASVATLANGASQNFVWTAAVTGNVYDTYTVSGNATTTTAGISPAATASSSSADIHGFVVSVNPNVNAYSTHQEMTWTVTNHGCTNAVNSVSIPIPAGWTWEGDSYSLVQTGAGTSVETGDPGGWTASGSNPVLFTAGTALPVDLSADFSLTLTTPSVTATTVYNPTATVTDTGARSMTPSDAVTVDPFKTGGASGPNATAVDIWQEIFP